MTDSMLTKYTRSMTEPDDPSLESEDLGSFGWLRGMRERATMLELRHKNGNVTAIAYAMIEKLEFNPSDGITIHALGQQFRLQGRHLNTETRHNIRLFQGLTRHRVPWIQEADEPARLDAISHSSGGFGVEFLKD